MGYGYQNFITRQIPTALLFCICFNYFVLHNITSSFTTSNVIKPSRQTRANNNEKHHLKHPFVLQVQPTMSLASGRKLKTRQPSLPIHTLSLLLWPATQRQVAIHPCKTPATRHHRQAHLARHRVTGHRRWSYGARASSSSAPAARSSSASTSSTVAGVSGYPP